MAKITYDDKEIYVDGTTNSQYFRYQDANEIKSVVNANDTRLEHLYELLSQETTQTGTEITIDNTFADNMQLDLKGNTSQYTTTGVQMLNIPNGTYNNAGVTAVVENGKVTLNGTASGTSFIRIPMTTSFTCTANTNYTMSVNNSNTVGSLSPYAAIRLNTGSADDSTTDTYFNVANNTLTFSKTSDTTYATFTIKTGGGLTYNNFVIYPQLQIGDSSTSWEQYTGEIPSPNPQYPQQVKVVTGNNNIKIVGKNLFNKNNTGVSSRTTITSIETGIRAVCTSTNRFCYGNFIIGGEELQGKTLTLTCNMSASGTNKGRAWLYGLNENKALVAGSNFGNFLDSNGSVTTTIPSTFPTNVKYVGLLLYSNADSTTAQIGDYCDYTNVQVEKSSTATTYEDYQEQTYEIDLGNAELCKIEDYQDYFFKENDKWYKHETIEKIILNGTQGSWTKGSASGEVYSVFQATSWGLNKYVRNTTEILSDKTTGGNANSAPLTGEHIQIGGQASAPIRISILNSRLSEISSNGFNAFLTNNNFTCYIPLTTPIDIEITDTTLKNQLDNILNAQSYDYQTNITQTNAILPFIITATARVERS